MKRRIALSLFLTFPILAWIGCGGGGPGSFSTNPQAAAVYVTGEDAPLSSVVSLNLTINSITLTGQSNSPQLVASPITVDFARLVGLRTPLAFKAVPPDTYSSATFVLASPVIDYISTVSPPQVTTLNGTFSSPTSTAPQTTSVTVNFPTPMVVGANGLAGLHTEFDIRQSLAVDGTGQITGLITPVMFIQAVKAIDPEGQITDLTGTIVSVNVPGNSFVLQGPFGHQFTVDVSGATIFNQGFSLASLPTSGGFVALQGTVQQDGSILASDVEFITTDLAFVSGRILAINPASGPVQTVTLWVGETGGGTSSLVDTVQTIDVSAVSTYDICFFNNSWFSPNNLFGNSSMLVGQRIFIGGTFVTPTFTPDFISLRRQGVYWPGGAGQRDRDQRQCRELPVAEHWHPGAVARRTADSKNRCRNPVLPGQQQHLTLTDLQTATATSSVPVIARGLVLKDTTTGDPVLWAHRVRETQ